MRALLPGLQTILPQHALSRLVGRVAASRWRPLSRALIWSFTRLYEIDMDEAADPDPYAYPSFNALFTRALATGVRRIDTDPLSIVSPVDGTVSECGPIRAGRLIQAKGRDYTAAGLLARETSEFDDGSFVTIYLAPHNYHRIHVPFDADLRQMTHVPGRLFSVGATTTGQIDRLFARNERVVFDFDTACGPMALVMVGALNVGGIETVHGGVITPPRGRRLDCWRYETPRRLGKGEELARFNLGSTVVMMFGPRRVRLQGGLGANSGVRLGQRLATVIESV